MTVGASIALFVPFYLITRSLDRHLDQVAADTAQKVEGVRTDTAKRVEEIRSEAAASVGTLSNRVEALRADVDRRLDEVANRVTARLDAEAAADREAFASLRTNAPTREGVWEAMERALRLGLVSPRRPPRVDISQESHLYVSVELDTDEWADEPLQLRIETLNGVVQDWIPWPQEADAEEVLVEVGRALLKHTGERFDPTAFLVGLANLLDAASSHPRRRPAIQLCPPQWMVCEWGVIPYDRHSYEVTLRELQTSTTIENHVADKTWVHEESWEAANEAALALFPPNPWGGNDPAF